MGGEIDNADDITHHRCHTALILFTQLPQINAKSRGDKNFQENDRQIVNSLQRLLGEE
jgi:hypothetical protein